jgi:Ser-tRNA(Ala) deacylase AlaX
MTKALFLVDSYLREAEAIVVSVKEGKYITLDQTIFYAKGGGQPHDTGKIIKGDEEYDVVYVGKFSGEISHEVNRPGFNPETKFVAFSIGIGGISSCGATQPLM